MIVKRQEKGEKGSREKVMRREDQKGRFRGSHTVGKRTGRDRLERLQEGTKKRDGQTTCRSLRCP